MRTIATITVDDIGGLIGSLAGEGRAPRTIARALATLGSSPFARLLEPDNTEADNVVVIARRLARGPAARRRALGRPRT